MLVTAFMLGLLIYAASRFSLTAFYTIKPDERAVVTTFGRAHRLGAAPAASAGLDDDERSRYIYPRLRVIGPGGPYYKWPWQEVHRVRVVTEALDLAWDPTKEQSAVEAVTKDNLTTGVGGQIRFRVSEENLYPYLFGVDNPLQHVMGYFISVLRERIANFVDPKGQSLVGDSEFSDSAAQAEMTEGVSINDLRKNLPLINSYMEEQCRSTAARYGIELDAALITQIDPPSEVDRALSAINTTRNQVAADISTASADAEQQITLSKRAVEIARNNAQAEVAPLQELADTLAGVKARGGSGALALYLRNLRVPLLGNARRIVRSNAECG